MSKNKAKWLKRDDEWIKANPGKPTMYKVVVDVVTIEESERDQTTTQAVKKLLTPKGRFPDAGIYAVVCEIEMYVYIGQSTNMGSRLRNHKMIILGGASSEEEKYVLIKEHVKIHGADAIQFVKIKVVKEPEGDGFLKHELLREEANAMEYYFNKGYRLYNKAIPQDMFNNSVLVTPQYKPVVNNLVKLLTEGRITIDQVRAFISSITSL